MGSSNNTVGDASGQGGGDKTNLIARAGAEAADFYYKGGDPFLQLTNMAHLGATFAGFSAVNTVLKNQLETPDTPFRKIVENVTTTLGTSRDDKNFEKLVGRNGYIMYNWIEFLPFALFAHITNAINSQYLLATGKREKTAEEIEVDKMPLLQKITHKVKSATRVVFKDVFGCFMASLGDVLTEEYLKEALRNIPTQADATTNGIPQFVIPRLKMLDDLLAQEENTPLAAKSTEMLLDLVAKLDPDFRAGISHSRNEEELEDKPLQRKLIKKLIDELKSAQTQISECSVAMNSRMLKDPDNAVLEDGESRILSNAAQKMQLIANTFRNFSSEDFANPDSQKMLDGKAMPTGITGGIAVAERLKADELAGGSAQSEQHKQYASIFRESANFIAVFAGGLQKSGIDEPGIKLKSESKFWPWVEKSLTSLGIPKGIATAWMIAGTSFGPGFNLCRYVAYDLFDAVIWPDKKKQAADKRTFGEKLADFLTEKSAIVGSVYTGAVGMAPGIEAYSASIKSGKLGEITEEIATKTQKMLPNLKIGGSHLFGEQGMNWFWYRAAQFLPYLPLRESSKHLYMDALKPTFSALGNAVDNVMGNKRESGRGSFGFANNAASAFER